MKKLLLGCTLVAVLDVCETSAMFDYSSSSSGSAKKEVGFPFDSNKNNVPANESTYRKTGKEALEGFYLAAGLLQSASAGKSETVGSHYKCGTIRNAAAAVATFNNVGDQLHAVGLYGMLLDTTVGPRGAVTGFSAKSLGKPLVEGKNNKFSGAVSLGWGAFFNENNYLGVELALDIAGNRKKDLKDSKIVRGHAVAHEDMGLGDMQLRQTGFSPTVASRCGIYSAVIDALIYARLGTSYVKSELDTKHGKIKLSKLVPVIGLGFEKKMSDSVSFRLECDYKIPSEKKGNLKGKEITAMVEDATANVRRLMLDQSSDIKLKSRGYAIRMMAVYSF